MGFNDGEAHFAAAHEASHRDLPRSSRLPIHLRHSNNRRCRRFPSCRATISGGGKRFFQGPAGTKSGCARCVTQGSGPGIAKSLKIAKSSETAGTFQIPA
jgi:hypothetical protein